MPHAVELVVTAGLRKHVVISSLLCLPLSAAALLRFQTLQGGPKVRPLLTCV